MKFKELKKEWNISKKWTLFLDRDGVINHETKGKYILNVESFKFIKGSLDAIAYLTKEFNRTIIVTNQQGIGKKLMTEENLSEIHKYMVTEIERHQGSIDAIYYSPFLTSEKNIMQKPNIGMGLKAKKNFPDINFNQSIMIGNSERDIIFGKTLEMKTIYVGEPQNKINSDFTIQNLSDLID